MRRAAVFQHLGASRLDHVFRNRRDGDPQPIEDAVPGDGNQFGIEVGQGQPAGELGEIAGDFGGRRMGLEEVHRRSPGLTPFVP